jgi:hypothetical protein
MRTTSLEEAGFSASLAQLLVSIDAVYQRAPDTVRDVQAGQTRDRRSTRTYFPPPMFSSMSQHRPESAVSASTERNELTEHHQVQSRNKAMSSMEDIEMTQAGDQRGSGVQSSSCLDSGVLAVACLMPSDDQSEMRGDA